MKKPKYTTSRFKILLAIILWLVSLQGCTRTSSKQQTQFNSLITTSGLKLFEMTFPQPTTDIRNTKENPRKGAWSDKKVIAHLNDAITQNQFCRDGYIILGRYAGETTHKIRGECKEIATLQDQQKYPNSITRW